MYLHEELTSQIIKTYYNVYHTLGYGFLEKVYEKALVMELQSMGFSVECQKPIKVYYKESIVGDYYADIVVNDIVILELKVAESLCQEHEFQLINYLKATNMEVGLLFNFGQKPLVSRKIFTNDRK